VAWPNELGDSSNRRVDILTLNANGSYTWDHKRSAGDHLVTVAGQTADTSGGPFLWDVVGDTLQLHQVAYDAQQRRQAKGEFMRKALRYNAPARYVFAVHGPRLHVWEWLLWQANRRDEKCSDSFIRVDTSKPLVWPAPPARTINPADLTGTWAGTHQTFLWGTVTDTLIMGADHSLRAVHLGPYDTANRQGTWSLLPGDILEADTLGNALGGRLRVVLKNDTLIRCHPNYAILKRVAP
jgi:hypothetical protein